MEEDVIFVLQRQIEIKLEIWIKTEKMLICSQAGYLFWFSKDVLWKVDWNKPLSAS